MGYWVYLARCGNNTIYTIYTGATTDLIRRVREHNQGPSGGHGAKYTAAHRPVSLAQAWEVGTWSDALRLEHAIKKCTRSEKDQLIKQPEQILRLAELRDLPFSITGTSQELLKQTEGYLMDMKGGESMPIVQVELLEGRTLEQKRILVEKVTQAIVDSIGAPAENVTIIIRDMSKENFSKAGKLACDK